MPTATWQSGQTSGAAGGSGYGTGSWQTAAGYNPTTGNLVCVFVFGITNNANEITGGTLASTSVATGTNPTMSQHPAGWLTASAVGTTYTPFASMFYVNNIAACTGLRFTFDATDSIYQWFAIIVEYSSQDTSTPFGAWGSDVGNGDTADSQSTTLDQNVGGGIGANSHVVGVIVADGSAGAVAPGTGWVERYEGPSGSGQTLAQVQDDQTSPDNTCEWGAITPTVFGWCTFAVEVRHGSSGVTGTSAQTLANFTSSASGTVANPVTGTSAQTLANFTSTASGQERYTGTSAQTLANFTGTASGTVANPVTGAVAVTLANATSTASGTETMTGTVAVTLANFTGAASGTETITGSSAQTLANLTSSAAGTVANPVTGTVAVTLANFTGAASGTETITGSLAVTLADTTGSASGTVQTVGSVAITLANATSTASGTVTISGIAGSAAVTLADFTGSASGTVTPPAVTGTVAVTLANLTSSASGAVTLTSVTGSSAQTLANFVAAAVGVVTGFEVPTVVVVGVGSFTPVVELTAGSFTPTVAPGTGSHTPEVDLG